MYRYNTHVLGPSCMRRDRGVIAAAAPVTVRFNSYSRPPRFLPTFFTVERHGKIVPAINSGPNGSL